MSVSLNGTNGLTFADSTTQNTGGYTGFRNRIINGDMRIDQRNAGASVTPTVVGGTYTVDRWAAQISVASKFSVQQNAGSVTPPAGVTNYLGATSLSAYSVGATENFDLQQRIEGLNMADLAWGTASASAVTLSFYVYSSLTGTFGGFLCNGVTNYSYPFSYTISAANTWQRITLTIAGPTSGTWLTTNGIGVFVGFSLGAGSSTVGTGGSWYNGTLYRGATGQVNVVGTNGATFYITGVQLEKGSVATPFEFRPYGTELQLCQRYYEVGSVGAYSGIMSDNFSRAYQYFRVTKRTTPTVTLGTGGSGTATGFVDGIYTFLFGAACSVGTGTIANAEL